MTGIPCTENKLFGILSFRWNIIKRQNSEITQPAKSLKSNNGVFVESAFKIRYHIVKNTLLHIAFLQFCRLGRNLVNNFPVPRGTFGKEFWNTRVYQSGSTKHLTTGLYRNIRTQLAKDFRRQNVYNDVISTLF